MANDKQDINAAALAPRAGVMSLSIKEKSALYAAYMPYLKGGGLFIPTPKEHKLGDEVFMLLTLLDDPVKIPVAGKVVWITPPEASGNRIQGIGVQFNANEAGLTARNKIEGLLGGLLKSSRHTHTM
jgi:type IV pilus assembly protein PilZ